jgi:hypothetical protein
MLENNFQKDPAGSRHPQNTSHLNFQQLNFPIADTADTQRALENCLKFVIDVDVHAHYVLCQINKSLEKSLCKKNEDKRR